jgi:hypothetical protein
MKLSKETLGLLKNFSGINSNLVLRDTGKLTTISAQKNIMASANVSEAFPAEFGIYDLNEFLGAMSLFTDPDLVFSEKFVTVKEGGNSIKYTQQTSLFLHIHRKRSHSHPVMLTLL